VGDEGGGIYRSHAVDLGESEDHIELFGAVLPDQEALGSEQPVGVGMAANVKSYVLAQVVDIARVRELSDGTSVSLGISRVLWSNEPK